MAVLLNSCIAELFNANLKGLFQVSMVSGFCCLRIFLFQVLRKSQITYLLSQILRFLLRGG